MPWAKCLLHFTMTVMTLSSSLTADSKAFSETGASYGADSEDTVRFGNLLIGGESTASDSDMKTSGLRSRESNEVRFRLAKMKLQRLSPSVQCSNDSMILSIPGPRTPHFLVDRGDESPVSLSEMPASCGFSLKRVRRDVSLVAPYKGCHVKRQGGRFVLPLIIMGAPAQVSCPVSSCLPEVSCFSSGMTIKLAVRADDVKVKVAGSWQPLLRTLSQCSFTLEFTDASLVITTPFTGSCLETTDTEWQLPLLYGDREVTVSCRLTTPTTAPTTPAVRDPYMPQIYNPFPFPWWYPPYPGVPVDLPPNVQPATTTATPPLKYPIYPRPIFNPYYPYLDPAAPLVPQAQYPWYAKLPPNYGFQSPADVTTPAPTTTLATTTAPAPYWPLKQYPGFPMYPPFYGPQYLKNPVFVPRKS